MSDEQARLVRALIVDITAKKAAAMKPLRDAKSAMFAPYISGYEQACDDILKVIASTKLA